MNTEPTRPTGEATSPASSAPPTTIDDLRRRREDLRRRFFVGPSDPAARSVWRVSQIYWVVVLYSGVWIVCRANGLGGDALPTGSTIALTVLFGVGAIHLFLRSALTVRRGGYGSEHFSRISWLHTAIDLALVAATVRVTGGIESGIWPLFFVISVAESVLEPIREARWVRIGVCVALVAATVPFPLRSGTWVLELLTRLMFLVAVSTVAQRLRQNADREKNEIASLRAEMGLLEERSNLSREVHDGVGNALAASVLRLEVTARVLAKQSGADGETPVLLREEAQALRDAMNEVRDWTFFNKPWSASGDEPAGIGMRLEAEVERLSRRTNLPMRVRGADALDDLRSGTARLAVLRIVQEALTNAAKYATGATEALVTIERDGDRLLLTVRDDGEGFDTATASAGIGMTSMRERATGLGGSLDVESTPGQGTTVSVRLPLM
ncbi:MAG: sensor histidine kinase [Akkermansiaceae bacterium]|nr:sensor histidine kinase [Armatimonadota bacterium]